MQLPTLLGQISPTRENKQQFASFKAVLPRLLNRKNNPPTLLQNIERRFDVRSLYIIHSSLSPRK